MNFADFMFFLSNEVVHFYSAIYSFVLMQIV